MSLLVRRVISIVVPLVFGLYNIVAWYGSSHGGASVGSPLLLLMGGFCMGLGCASLILNTDDEFIAYLEKKDKARKEVESISPH
jgi:hypothetical protein